MRTSTSSFNSCGSLRSSLNWNHSWATRMTTTRCCYIITNNNLLTRPTLRCSWLSTEESSLSTMKPTWTSRHSASSLTKQLESIPRTSQRSSGRSMMCMRSSLIDVILVMQLYVNTMHIEKRLSRRGGESTTTWRKWVSMSYSPPSTRKMTTKVSRLAAATACQHCQRQMNIKSTRMTWAPPPAPPCNKDKQ